MRIFELHTLFTLVCTKWQRVRTKGNRKGLFIVHSYVTDHPPKVVASNSKRVWSHIFCGSGILGQLGWVPLAQGLFHKSAKAAVTSKLDWGKIHFSAPGSHSWWQALGPHWLWPNKFFATKASGHTKRTLTLWHVGSLKAREQETPPPKTEVTVFSIVIWEVTAHHLCCIVFIKSKSVHLLGGDYTRAWMRQGSLGTILEAAYHASHREGSIKNERENKREIEGERREENNRK